MWGPIQMPRRCAKTIPKFNRVNISFRKVKTSRTEQNGFRWPTIKIILYYIILANETEGISFEMLPESAAKSHLQAT